MALPTPSDILPKSPTEASVPPASDAESDVPATIPDEVLEIPAVFGLLRGAPPAIYADLKTQGPELDILGKHAPELVAAGLGFYSSLDKKLGVLFNTAYVTEEQLAKADADGKLTEVAAPFEETQKNFGGAVAPAPSAAAPVSSGAPATPARVTNARVRNLQPGSPTSGPVPGAGRVLNNILKSTI